MDQRVRSKTQSTQMEFRQSIPRGSEALSRANLGAAPRCESSGSTGLGGFLMRARARAHTHTHTHTHTHVPPWSLSTSLGSPTLSRSQDRSIGGSEVHGPHHPSFLWIDLAWVPPYPLQGRGEATGDVGRALGLCRTLPTLNSLRVGPENETWTWKDLFFFFNKCPFPM